MKNRLTQKNIKKYLDDNGIKQTFLQKKLNMSISSVNAMLNGNRGMSASEYFKICDVLGVPLDFFNDGAATPEENSK